MKNSYISERTTIPTRGHPQKPDPSKAIDSAKPVVNAENVKKYLTAELSLKLFGPVKNSVFEDRREQCMTCPSRFESTQIKDDIGFCKSCSCGVTEKARLSKKLTMPEVSCPIGRWGPSRPHHKRFVDRAKSWLLRKLIG